MPTIAGPRDLAKWGAIRKAMDKAAKYTERLVGVIPDMGDEKE